MNSRYIKVIREYDFYIAMGLVCVFSVLYFSGKHEMLLNVFRDDTQLETTHGIGEEPLVVPGQIDHWELSEESVSEAE